MATRSAEREDVVGCCGILWHASETRGRLTRENGEEWWGNALDERPGPWRTDHVLCRAPQEPSFFRETCPHAMQIHTQNAKKKGKNKTPRLANVLAAAMIAGCQFGKPKLNCEEFGPD